MPTAFVEDERPMAPATTYWMSVCLLEHHLIALQTPQIYFHCFVHYQPHVLVSAFSSGGMFSFETEYLLNKLKVKPKRCHFQYQHHLIKPLVFNLDFQCCVSVNIYTYNHIYICIHIYVHPTRWTSIFISVRQVSVVLPVESTEILSLFRDIITSAGTSRKFYVCHDVMR